MVGGIATIAEKQYVLSFGRVAYGAGVAGLVFVRLGVLSLPLLDIELGHLLLVLDIVGRDCGAFTWTRVSA